MDESLPRNRVLTRREQSQSLFGSTSIKAILKRFGMKDCKPAKTLIDRKVHLTKPAQANEKIMKQYPY